MFRVSNFYLLPALSVLVPRLLLLAFYFFLSFILPRCFRLKHIYLLLLSAFLPALMSLLNNHVLDVAIFFIPDLHVFAHGQLVSIGQMSYGAINCEIIATGKLGPFAILDHNWQVISDRTR